MTEETEPDNIPQRALYVAIAVMFGAIVVSIVVVWLLAGRVAHGGGRSNIATPRIEPPADPFETTTFHEQHRAEQHARLDHWEWSDASHTRVRMPIKAAIEHYLAGGTK